VEPALSSLKAAENRRHLRTRWRSRGESTKAAAIGIRRYHGSSPSAYRMTTSSGILDVLSRIPLASSQLQPNSTGHLEEELRTLQEELQPPR